MKKPYQFFLMLNFAALLLAVAGTAPATTSVVQLNVEGNATCSSLTTNAVLQAKDTTVPEEGASDTATGPDGQVFHYTIGSKNVTSDTVDIWTASNPNGPVKPVNFVILKGAGSAGAIALYFGSTGVLTDTFATAPAKIAAISFCYGLPTSSVPSVLLPCDQNLFGQICAVDPTRIVTIFDESTPNWNIQTCTCGSTFTECNPELQAGTAGACTNANGALQFLPVEVQLGRDPDSYYCTIIGGTRKCYRK